MTAVFAYVTAPSVEEAERLGAALVEERLAACANIFPAMRSVYRWKGAIEKADEAVLVAKTRQPLVQALIARVKELHSYEVPCVVTLPITDGLPEFLRWIDDETAPQTDNPA